jgi:flagellar protein FliS
MDNGGQLASRLDSLYQFIIDQLTTANLKNDLKALDQAEQILVTLKEGFEGAYHQMKSANSTLPQVMEEPRTAQEGVCFAL